MTVIGLSIGVALTVWGCGPSAQRRGAADTSAAPTGADSSVFVGDTAPTIRPTVSKPSAREDSGAARRVTAPRRVESEPSPSIATILASSALVGQRVRVTGRCLGYGKPVAVGAPPRTRSDWQLEAEDVAIYVTGRLPAGCSPTGGSTQATTILALVAEDTLAARAGRPATPRRYLVRVPQ